MVEDRQCVCTAEDAAGASPPATEIMLCGPDTLSNLLDDKKEEGKKKPFC